MFRPSLLRTLPRTRAAPRPPRLRLRLHSTTPPHHPSPPPSTPALADTTTTAPDPHEPRLSLTFTCTAEDCTRIRSSHTFTRRAYERGIVLVQCPGCKNRHLIADNLGWFKESTEGGALRTVEDILRARGEEVRRGRVGEGGDVEFYE